MKISIILFILKSLNTLLIHRNNNIPPNQKSFVYNAIIRENISDAWNYLWDNLVNSNYAIEKETYWMALAHSQNATNLEK